MICLLFLFIVFLGGALLKVWEVDREIAQARKYRQQQETLQRIMEIEACMKIVESYLAQNSK